MSKILLLILTCILLSFTSSDSKSDYNVPLAVYSVTTGDIEMDGEVDIVMGHLYNEISQWTGISVLKNSGNGYFVKDTFYISGQHRTVITTNFNNNNILDLITQYYEGQSNQIGITYDFIDNQSDYQSILINFYADGISIGNIDNDFHADIIFYSNINQKWGVIYNQGYGNFTVPEYFNLDYYPLDIDCGDLNGDTNDDVVVSGSNVEIYYSSESGFEKYLLGDHQFDVEIVDIDADGDNDVVGLTWQMGESSITIYENTGFSEFVEHELQSFEPLSSKFITSNLNNDSLIDVIVLPSTLDGFYIFYNNGSCILNEPVFIPVEYYNEGDRNAASADLDGNGYNDIVIIRYLHAQLPANVTILFNDGKGNFVEEPIANIQITKLEAQKLKCYPNPFTIETTFEFYIEESALAELSVYNLQGKIIISLTYNNKEGGNLNTIKWNGLDYGGKPCKPGPYFVYLKVNGKIRQSVKLIKSN